MHKRVILDVFVVNSRVLYFHPSYTCRPHGDVTKSVAKMRWNMGENTNPSWLYSLAVAHVVACVLAAFMLCWQVGHTCRQWWWCWHVCWQCLRRCWWCWCWPGHSYFVNHLQEGDEQEFHAERMRVVLVCCCSWRCCHTCWCWHLCWWHSH